MILCGSFRRGSSAAARGFTVPEPPALDPEARVRYVRANGIPNEACIYIMWKFLAVKGQDSVFVLNVLSSLRIVMRCTAATP